ncbi:hypothetical protein V3C33_12815 [Micrococcaceae bacterium Sec5.7]
MEDSATPQPAEQPVSNRRGLVKYARPALIAGAAVAIVCIALLAIIFALDAFNATVYSVGGKNINDATDEARDIRGLYSAARIGGIVFLIVSALTAAAAALVLYRKRNASADEENDNGEDVDFDDLAGR